MNDVLSMSPLALMALFILAGALVLVAVRLVCGPTLSDRVVALDMLSYVAIGFIAAYVATTGASAVLDAALVLALVAFLATVAFARFVEQRPL
jgi:multicomponent Na+:H+ antiporter subunit F